MKKAEETKKEKKSSSKLLILGMFIAEFVFFILATARFYNGNHAYGAIFLALAVALNIAIFVKGGKFAAVLGVLFLLFVLVISGAVALYGFSLTKEVTADEKQQILAEKKESVDNLFEGYKTGDYEIFSRDLSDGMKERYNKIEFLNLRDGLGKITSIDCSNASKSTLGWQVVLCEVELENAKARWDIRYINSEIVGLYFEVLFPDMNLTIINKSVLTEIPVTVNGSEIILNNTGDNTFILFEISLKNNQEQEVKVRSFSFESQGYSFGQIIPKTYDFKCNYLISEVIPPNEEKKGCVVFSVVKGYTDGEIKLR